MSTDWNNDADPLGDAIDAIDVSSRDGFRIDVQRPAAAVVLLRVEGVLDLWTSLPLMDAILHAFSEHPGLIAIDLSDVLSMDDTGLHVLLEGSRHIEAGGVRFAAVCPAGSEMTRVLERADVQRTLNIHESVDDALGPWLDGVGDLPAGV